MASLLIQKATLILRTDELTNNATSDVGTCDQYNTNFTWKNVNMKMLLGDMAKDYDDFGISLSYMCISSTGATYGTAQIDRSTDINFSGLTLKNSGYNALSKTNKQSFNILSFAFTNATTGTVVSPTNIDSASFVFTNDQDLVDINIKYTRTFKSGSSYDVATTSAFPQMTFTFKIIGIPRKVEHKLLNLK